MQSTTIISENVVLTASNQPKKTKKKINVNYLMLIAITLFSCILLVIGFPLWVVLVFGLGMSFILFILYVISGIHIELKLNAEELHEAIEQDLFY